MAYGFVPLRKRDGSPYVGGLSYAYIVEGSQAYCKGDLLSANASATAETSFKRGEVGIGSAINGATAIGIAQYFEYTDTDGNFHQTDYIPAATALGNTSEANRIKVFYVPVYPDIVFKCTCDDDTQTLAATYIGQNFDIVIGAANATTHISGHELDSSENATTAATPLQLIGLLEKPGNAWGNTAGTVEVEVVFISSFYRALGSTGI